MSTRLFYLAACTGLLLASGARLGAQTTTNVDCWTYSSGNVSCRSRTSPDLGTSIANVFAGYAEDQRRREATQRAAQLAASQRALTEALARDREYAARVDQERAQAQARLFWRRAEFVLSAVADSFALDLRGAERLNQAAVPLLADLLVAYPDASSEAIADNLLPVTMPIVRRSSGLWEASQDWIDRNEQLISTLASAERNVLARGLIEGRTEAMSTQGSGAAILQRFAESAIQDIQRNRSVCAQGDTSCDRAQLPPSLQRTHDVARESRARREEAATRAQMRKEEAATRLRTREVAAQLERRRRVVDSASAIIASRLARQPDGPQIRPALENHLKSQVEGLTLDVTLHPNALADASFSRLASADAACRELLRCDAGLVSPDALAEFVRGVAASDSAASLARAQRDTAAALQTCQLTPLDCRLDLIPSGERVEYEILAEDARRFPARWRLPADVVAKLLEADSVIIFVSSQHTEGRVFSSGARAQVRKRALAAGDFEMLYVFEHLPGGSSPARRVNFKAVIHGRTGAVIRQIWSQSTEPRSYPASLFSNTNYSCLTWAIADENATERLPNDGFDLLRSIAIAVDAGVLRESFQNGSIVLARSQRDLWSEAWRHDPSITCAAPAGSRANPSREGRFLTLGAGFAGNFCSLEGCLSMSNGTRGASTTAGLGMFVRSRFALAVDFADLTTKLPNGLDSNDFFYGATGIWYPSPKGRWHLIIGIGRGRNRISNGSDDVTVSGLASSYGAGYDIDVGARMSLTSSLRFFRTHDGLGSTSLSSETFAGWSAEMLQFGLVARIK